MDPVDQKTVIAAFRVFTPEAAQRVASGDISHLDEGDILALESELTAMARLGVDKNGYLVDDKGRSEYVFRAVCPRGVRADKTIRVWSDDAKQAEDSAWMSATDAGMKLATRDTVEDI